MAGSVLQDAVETAVIEIERNGRYGRGYVRGALHKFAAQVSQRWAPAYQNQLVLSIAEVYHYNCPKDKSEDDGPSPLMPLVDKDENGATFRCVLCGDEVHFGIDFVVPGTKRQRTRKAGKKKR